MTAVFTTVTRSHTADLVDLSSTGARLCGDDLPEEGEELLVSIGPVRAFGKIMWSGRGQCGVEFDAPLPADDVEIVRKRVMEGAGFAPGVKEAMDDWTVGLAR